MTIRKRDLQDIAKELRALTRQTDKLIKVAEKLEKAQAAERRKAETRARMAKRAAERKSAAAKKTTDRVINLIKRSKKGVGVSTLMKKTGYDEKKVRNIVSRAFKQGKTDKTQGKFYLSRRME